MERQRRDFGQDPPVDWRAADSDGELSDSDDEWWSDDSSCSTCSSASYDDDRWSVASEAISGGELFYIECKAQNLQLAQKMKKKLHQSGTSSTGKSRSWRKGAHGTLVRLMKRGRKKIDSKSKKDEEGSKEAASSQRRLSSTSLEQSSGEIIEVRLLVEPRRHNLGRRATSIEILLGIVPGNFSMNGDDDRIMVAGFIPDMPASLSKKMKIGDWLHSIDGNQVLHSNIDNLLSKISSNSTVTLRLRRVDECSNVHAAPYLLSKGLEIDHLLQIMCKGSAASCKGSLLLLDKEDKVIYSYPDNGKFVDARGLFLTLAQFFADSFESGPISTRISFDNVDYLVLYQTDDNYIVLLFVPMNGTQEQEAIEFFNKFIEAIHFSYHSFFRASSEYKTRLDLLVDSLFCQLQKNERQILFNTHTVGLPNKIQNEVDNALSQLEAAPMNIRASSTMFYGLGSCLVYKNVCLRNHLPEGILSQVTSLLWIHNVLSLEQEGLPIQRLLAWKEVFPSEQQIPPEAYEEPPGRYYFLLLGHNQFMIGVLLKTDLRIDSSNDDIMKPSISYIEQVQETLDTLQIIGLAGVLDTLLDDNSAEIAEKGSISDQQSISSDQNYFQRTNSVEGIKRFSPKRQSSRLSVNSECETFSETSSEASWNSSELSSYGRLSKYKSPSRYAPDSFDRGLQSILVTSNVGSVVLVSATLKESLSLQVDNTRLQLMHMLSQDGPGGRFLGAINEVGVILSGRGKKSDDLCVLAGKRIMSGEWKVIFVCSEDVGINLTELASRLALMSL